jgi:prevent-host-death family protein
MATRTVTATEAKNEFGRLLDTVMQGAAVVITKHDAPRAVLLSMEAFTALSEAGERQLDSLSEEFDALLARQQTSKAKAGMKAAFAASPRQLGKAALAAARSRGR